MSAPRSPIARRIFEALDAETRLRPGRTLQEWDTAERALVQRLVNEERAKLGKEAVDESAIRRVEDGASGHIDYLRKFALGAEELC